MKNIPDPNASMLDPQLLILFLEVIYKFLGSGPLVEKKWVSVGYALLSSESILLSMPSLLPDLSRHDQAVSPSKIFTSIP